MLTPNPFRYDFCFIFDARKRQEKESGHLPVLEPSGSGGEGGANLENFSAIGPEGPVVSFLLNLVQGILGVLVPLEFQDIDKLVGLDECVYPAVGGMALHLHLLSHELEHYIQGVLDFP